MAAWAGWVLGVLAVVAVSASFAASAFEAPEGAAASAKTRERVATHIMGLAWVALAAVFLLLLIHGALNLRSDFPGQEVWVWGCTLVLGVIAYLEVRYGGFMDRLKPWYKTNDESLTAVALSLARSLLSLAAAFIAITSILLSYDLLDTSQVAQDGQETAMSLADGEIVPTAVRYYLWNLLDAIPSLKVPETLNWKLDVDLSDSWSGAILLAFKLLVLIPVVRGVKELVDQFKARGTPPAEA
jgi:hypothetical protein